MIRTVLFVLCLIVLLCVSTTGALYADAPVIFSPEKIDMLFPGLRNGGSISRERFFEIIGVLYPLKKGFYRGTLVDLPKRARAYVTVINYYTLVGFPNNNRFYPRNSIRIRDAVTVVNKIANRLVIERRIQPLTGPILFKILTGPDVSTQSARVEISLDSTPSPPVFVSTTSVVVIPTNMTVPSPITDNVDSPVDPFVEVPKTSDNNVKFVLSKEYIEKMIREKKKQFDSEQDKKVVELNLSYQLTGQLNQETTTVSRLTSKTLSYYVGLGVKNSYIPIECNFSYSYDNNLDNPKQNLIGLMGNASIFQEISGWGNVMALYTRSYTEKYNGNLFLIGNFYYGLWMLPQGWCPSRVFVKASRMNSLDNGSISPSASASIGVGAKQMIDNYSLSYEIKSFCNSEGKTYWGYEGVLGASFGLPFKLKLEPTVTVSDILSPLPEKTLDLYVPLRWDFSKDISVSLEGEYIDDYYSLPDMRTKKKQITGSFSQTF